MAAVLAQGVPTAGQAPGIALSNHELHVECDRMTDVSRPLVPILGPAGPNNETVAISLRQFELGTTRFQPGDSLAHRMQHVGPKRPWFPPPGEGSAAATASAAGGEVRLGGGAETRMKRDLDSRFAMCDLIARNRRRGSRRDRGHFPRSLAQRVDPASGRQSGIPRQFHPASRPNIGPGRGSTPRQLSSKGRTGGGLWKGIDLFDCAQSKLFDPLLQLCFGHKASFGLKGRRQTFTFHPNSPIKMEDS